MRTIYFFVSIFLSCSLNPVVNDPDSVGDYCVFCTLSPVSEYQEVYVSKTVPENLPINIDNASVIISSNGEDIPFRNVCGGLYRDDFTKLKVNPGQAYKLTIKLDSGKIITAETVIPDSFSIISPQSEDTLNHFIMWNIDTLQLPKIKWRRPKNGTHFTIYLDVGNQHNFVGSLASTFRQEAFIPELVARIQPPDYTIPADTIFVDAKILIVAHDSTEIFHPTARIYMPGYSDYTKEERLQALQNDGLHHSNIHGALGRFNGISMATIEIVLKVHIDLERQSATKTGNG